MMRRKKSGYFETRPGEPLPVTVRIEKRVNFNETDAMGIVWHGHYARFFEEASAELGRKCGLSYHDYYHAKVQAPIVQLHIDYHKPLMLEEIVTIEGRYVWSEGARLHTEYKAVRADHSIAAAGYTIQMFVDALTREPFLATPAILEKCRQRWLAGEFR